MPALVIGPAERDRIAELIAFASGSVFEISAMKAAAAADLRAYRDAMAMMSVAIPIGYNATYSHERQPIGVCRHISISVDRPGKAPSLHAVQMILAAFGMAPVRESLRVWVEDIPPHVAINLVQLARPA